MKAAEPPDVTSTGASATSVTVAGAGSADNASFNNTATLAQWQNALRAVTYNNTSQNPNTTARTVSFRVDDGGLNSNIATRGVTVTAVNDAPVLAAIEGTALAYTENDAATAISSSITVADVDNTTLTTATITISSNFQNGQDVLSFVNVPATMGNVAIQTNTGGVLTLTSAGATATLAQWQAALRAVKYNNSSDDPSTLTRTVTFQVNDGGAVNNLSNTQTRNITITAVNDAPTANGFAGLPAQAGIPISYPAAKLGGTDLEAGTTITIDTTPINVTNGTVAISANGSFVFTPLPNATTGSFQYRVSDNGNPAPGLNSAYVTVGFTVVGPAIYFVKNPAVGLANCTLGNECLLSTAVTNIGASTNARIFLEDANSHAAAVPLNSGGWLIGQGVTGTTFDALFGILAPAQGTLATRPSLALTSPTVQNTITLNASSSVRGLNISSTTNTGMNDQVGSIASVTVSEVAVTTTTATALLLSSVTSSTFSFTGLTTTGGAGLALTGTNTGSAFTFYSVSVSSGASNAFSATSGGTIEVCDETPCNPGATGALVNTLTTTSGTALNVNGMTITANNLEFRNISATSSPVNGIVLNNTGTAAGNGGLVVKGNGSTCTIATPTCDGGSIQSSTGTGISLTTTKNVSLTRMKVQNSGTVGGAPDHEIGATSVNGFSIDNSIITDAAGDVTLDDGINLTNTSGAVSITTVAISGAKHQGLTVDNLDTNMASFSMTGSTVTGTPGGDGMLMQMRGASTLTTGTIDGASAALGNTFSSNSATGLQVSNSSNGPGNGNIASLTVQNNTVTGNNVGMDFALSQNSSMTIVVQSNTFTNHKFQSINLFSDTGSTAGTMTATLRANTIGTPTVIDSGSTSNGNGIYIHLNGGKAGSITVDNNTINEVATASLIAVEAQSYGSAGTIKLQVTGNHLNKPTGTATNFCGSGAGVLCPSPAFSMFVDKSTPGAANGETICSTFSGNFVYDPSSDAGPNGAGVPAFQLGYVHPVAFSLILRAPRPPPERRF